MKKTNFFKNKNYLRIRRIQAKLSRQSQQKTKTNKNLITNKSSDQKLKTQLNQIPQEKYIYESVEEIERKFGIKLKTQYGYLPMTKIPGTNLIAESLILRFMYDGELCFKGKDIIICADEASIKDYEKCARDILIKNFLDVYNDPNDEEDGDDGDFIFFMHKHFVLKLLSNNDVESSDQILYAKTKNQGSCFTPIKEFPEHLDEDIFILGLIYTNAC